MKIQPHKNPAGRFYQPGHQPEDEASKGLAMTHEQVSDVFTEGQISPRIEQKKGKSRKIPREGY